MYTSQITHIKDITARNEAFKALSDSDKRKEIALDCLNLTLLRVVKGCDGSYWSGKLDDIEDDNAKSFQLKLNDNKLIKGCEVCARGGLMLSQIRLGNSINSDVRQKSYGSTSILQGFTIDSFEAMEAEYEGFSLWRELGLKHPYRTNTTKKLQNICLNVIHNGDYVPTDTTDYLKDFLASLKPLKETNV